MLPKTKEPGVESAGPNSRTADILVSERPAPINGSKDGNPSIKKFVSKQRSDTVSTKEHSTERDTIKEHSKNGSTPQPSDSKVSKRDTFSTKEHSTKRATIKEHSKNGSTAQPTDSKVSKTKDLGPSGHTPGILAAERPAPINGPEKNNPSIKRCVIRQPRATKPITREPQPLGS